MTELRITAAITKNCENRKQQRAEIYLRNRSSEDFMSRVKMSIKLITGLKETEDIQSQDDGARIYGTISSGDQVLEVGSILMTIKSANPSTYLGGTWIRWGAGRVPVGVDTSDTNFSIVEKTGGSKTHTLTAMEMPQHTHEYYHEGAGAILVRTDEYQSNVVNWGQTTKSTGIAGGSSAHNNLQPYITCYIWKRTT